MTSTFDWVEDRLFTLDERGLARVDHHWAWSVAHVHEETSSWNWLVNIVGVRKRPEVIHQHHHSQACIGHAHRILAQDTGTARLVFSNIGGTARQAHEVEEHSGFDEDGPEIELVGAPADETALIESVAHERDRQGRDDLDAIRAAKTNGGGGDAGFGH